MGIRAYQINANPELCSYIKQLRLFGSMLDFSILMVGDVDVAVEFGRRKPPLNQNGACRDWVEWNVERFEDPDAPAVVFLIAFATAILR